MKKFIKFGIPFLIFVFLFNNLRQQWPEVVSQIHTLNPLYLIIAFAFALLVYPEGAIAWDKLLHKMSIYVPLRKTFYIWIISNTSRYIPGTIWQYVGRVELAKKEGGISRQSTILSISGEMFLALSSAGIIVLLSLPTWGFIEFSGWWILLLLPVPLIFLHPKVLSLLLKKGARILKRDLSLYEFHLNTKDLVQLFPWYFVNFLLNGVALYFLVGSMIGVQPIFYILAYTGFYSLSWLVGYLSIFAPGGLGVAEASLSYLLSFSMPLSVALLVSVCYRVMLTLAEVVVFTSALKTYHGKNQHPMGTAKSSV